MNPILKNSESKTTLLYYSNVDIDGIFCRYEFSLLLQKNKRKKVYNRAHEGFAGNGAIGFQLLDDRHCKSLVLSDIYQPAIQGCAFTVALNNLTDKVTLYNTDMFDNIPDTERWDLYVANPPWRNMLLAEHSDIDNDYYRKLYDFDWTIHKKLWAGLTKYTTHDADIFIYEDSLYSRPETWANEIAEAGLKVYGVHKNFGITPTGYVMHLIKE